MLQLLVVGCSLAPSEAIAETFGSVMEKYHNTRYFNPGPTNDDVRLQKEMFIRLHGPPKGQKLSSHRVPTRAPELSERKRKPRLPDKETDPSEVDSDRGEKKKHKEKLAKKLRRTYPAEEYVPAFPSHANVSREKVERASSFISNVNNLVFANGEWKSTLNADICCETSS
ncbi:hypothetical protein ACHWQZ_G002547 [Mnemiopsis leidyi]